MNLGSGKDYRPGWVNVDVDPSIRADEHFDISDVPLSFSVDYCHQFDLIEAFHVFEHVNNLVACWENCLDLLKDGGRLHVRVPYDLSYGAWQDPTHVRAFNERSFLYPTDWCWYLGWHRTSRRRFKTTSLNYVLSDLGRKQRDDGKTDSEIVLTPRAIDELDVFLEAVPMTESEMEHCKKQAGDA